MSSTKRCIRCVTSKVKTGKKERKVKMMSDGTLLGEEKNKEMKTNNNGNKKCENKQHNGFTQRINLFFFSVKKNNGRTTKYIFCFANTQPYSMPKCSGSFMNTA